MLKSPKRKPDNSLYPANELRGLKEVAGLRVEDLAAKAGLAIPTVNEVLLGGNTKLSTLIAVAQALGARVKISFERE